MLSAGTVEAQTVIGETKRRGEGNYIFIETQNKSES